MRRNIAQRAAVALTLRCCARDMCAGAPGPSHRLSALTASTRQPRELEPGRWPWLPGIPKLSPARLAVLLCEHPFPQPWRWVHPGRLLP
jgi:hypothetical protein